MLSIQTSDFLNVRRTVSILLILFTSFPGTSSARINMGFDFGINQDQNTLASKNRFENSVYRGSVYLGISDKSRVLLGFEVSVVNQTYPVSTAATATLTAINPMPGIKFVFGPKDLFSVSFAGSTNIQAGYSLSSGGSEIWNGTGYVGRIILQPELTNHLQLLVGVSYASFTYNVKSATTEASELRAFTRTMLYPSIGFQLDY